MSASGITQNEILFYASSAEKGSEHPLGEAIIKKAKEAGIETASAEQFSAVPGLGIKATINGKQVMLGNEKLMRDEGVSTEVLQQQAVAFSEQGKTPMFVSVDNKIAGIIAVADMLKEDSVNAVKALHNLGIEVVMMTGDNKRTG